MAESPERVKPPIPGQVCIGTGQWQWLQANKGNSPANEFIVYATSPGGADYFIGFARVNEIP